MEDEPLSDDELREMRPIVQRINGGDCVLVLGPRVAVRSDDPNHTPLDELVAAHILEKFDLSADAGAVPPSLRHTAEAHYRKQKDPEELQIAVADFYGKAASATTPFHRDLAALPFRLCLSASPDDLMFKAFEEAVEPQSKETKKPQKGHYNFHGGTPEPGLFAPTAKRPLVYHLYGHYDDPPSLVLTEGDLIEFLVAVIRGIPPIPDEVRSLLTPPEASFLFFGFGFQNWYLRVLLHVLNAYGHRSKGIAFEDKQFFDHPDREQTVSFFSGDRQIEFRPLLWEQFAKKLRAAYERGLPKAKQAASATPQRQASNGRSPKVFVSYANDDRNDVEALAEQLESGYGIATWQDKQNLRAGDNWQRVLLDVITRIVDYVIVVQTPKMVSRNEGVYHEEIKAALLRQSRMREPLRFLIPVTMGAGCPVLPTLRDLHVIDVSTPEGIEALAQSILEDWQRRTPDDPTSGAQA